MIVDGRLEDSQRLGMNKTTSSLILLLTICIVLAGCAAAPRAKKPHPVIAGRPTTQATLSPNAFLKLDQIQPLKPLPTSPPASTQPAKAPLEAIQLFARARDAIQSGQRFTAVQLIDQARALDPNSFELNLAMGQYSSGTSLLAMARPALERAAQINPDSAQAYVEMAKLDMNSGKFPETIRILRQAQMTSAYKSGNEICLAIDYYLARTLQLAGYDTASLEQYEILLNRLPRVSMVYHGPVELMQVVRNPDVIFNEIATISARLGDYPTALAAIEQAMLEAPSNQQYAIARLTLLQQSGRTREAQVFAIELISRFGPRPEISLLLTETYKNNGGEAASLADLRKTCESRPDDANLGFALADILTRNGKPEEARQTLARLVTNLNYRQDAALRLFEFYETQGRTAKAAEVLVETSARRPELLTEISNRMARLARLSRSNHLRLRDLQEMKVESWAEAARLYWVAQIAILWDRDELARAAMEKAVRQGKPYAPAYRALLSHYWSRPDWDFDRKGKASQELVMLATLNGQASLAAELRGLSSLRLKRYQEA